MEEADDHRAAALYLTVHGFVKEAEAEIEAARILGADPRPLRERNLLLKRGSRNKRTLYTKIRYTFNIGT